MEIIQAHATKEENVNLVMETSSSVARFRNEAKSEKT